MKKEKAYNEAINGDEGFEPGDGYPSCDGEPCANVSDEPQDGLTQWQTRPTAAPHPISGGSRRMAG
ncbi:MAG: hypothetical protein ACLRMJ_04890 [Alistipes finegoldii]